MNAYSRARVDSIDGTQRVLKVLTWLALVAVCLGLALKIALGGSVQSFAQFGIAKSVSLPIAYLISVVSLAGWSTSRRLRFGRLPAWLGLFLLAIFVSVVLEAVVQPDEIFSKAFAEGLMLPMGFVCFFVVGTMASRWTVSELMRFVSLLAILTLVSIVAEISIVPFSDLAIPLGVSLVCLSSSTRLTSGARSVVGLLGVLLVGYEVVYGLSLVEDSLTGALIGQLAVCGVLAVLWKAPGSARRMLAGVFGVAGAFALIRLGLIGIHFGEVRDDWDVTLLQRAYEARSVNETLSGARFFVGGGPGATLDLSSSPDAPTLSASGRAIARVDDVHLLMSWIPFKFGLLGCVAFGLMLIWLAHCVVRVPSGTYTCEVDMVMLMFVFGSLAQAATAATYMFSNPLTGICMGVLWARQMGARLEAPWALRQSSDSVLAGG